MGRLVNDQIKESSRLLVNLEPLAQINAANVFVADDFIRCPAHQDATVVEDVGAVHDLKGLLDVMIGD